MKKRIKDINRQLWYETMRQEHTYSSRVVPNVKWTYVMLFLVPPNESTSIEIVQQEPPVFVDKHKLGRCDICVRNGCDSFLIRIVQIG